MYADVKLLFELSVGELDGGSSVAGTGVKSIVWVTSTSAVLLAVKVV